MATIVASRLLPHSPEHVFAFLSDLRNHWQLEDTFVAVNGVQPGAGRILIRGPLGISREARAEIVSAEAPVRLLGRATVGARTAGAVFWEIAPAADGVLVSLAARVERASATDRLLLALGGRLWLRRCFGRVLETLERRLG